jgi:hypothetical protein
MDGCFQNCSVRCALECRAGGLIVFHHNQIQDELSDLAAKAFSPSVARNKLLIHHRCNSKLKKVEPTNDNPSQPLFLNNCNEGLGNMLI